MKLCWVLREWRAASALQTRAEGTGLFGSRDCVGSANRNLPPGLVTAGPPGRSTRSFGPCGQQKGSRAFQPESSDRLHRMQKGDAYKRRESPPRILQGSPAETTAHSYLEQRNRGYHLSHSPRRAPPP